MALEVQRWESSRQKEESSILAAEKQACLSETKALKGEILKHQQEMNDAVMACTNAKAHDRGLIVSEVNAQAQAQLAQIEALLMNKK